MKNISIFLLGCVLGALVLGTVHAIRGIGSFPKAWDRTDVYSDREVRQRIKESGIDLPPGSRDLFYAINGFQDHGVWITFTIPRDQLWPVIEASLHKTKKDFSSGIPEEFLSKVEVSQDQQIDTSLWTPQTIRNPLHFSIREKGSYFENWVVDEENGRIFITKQNT